MKKQQMIVWCALLLTATACAADPRNQADAYRIRMEAESAAAVESAALEHTQALNALELQEAQRVQDVREANQAQAKISYGWILYWGGMAVTVSVVAVALSAGAGLSVALIEGGKAAGRMANLRANLIQIDHKSGQFPQLVQYLGNGKYSLTDPNTSAVLMLDTRNEPDRLMVAGAMAVRHALVMSTAAAKSQNPEGVAMIQPMVLDVVEAE